jgi:hypothetical protein
MAGIVRHGHAGGLRFVASPIFAGVGADPANRTVSNLSTDLPQPRALLAIAAAAQSLIAYNVSPPPTFLNRALVIAL